ncbi:MAG: hypothetical protein QM523_04000 [Candidatus Pacebacteria bacterium]|nr:hypothetical protein [Candidatus Paceibacterota bacterium]
MRIFQAETMPEAIKLVRSELGENAIIVSSQRGDNGRGVRVTAAIDERDSEFDSRGPESDGSRQSVAHNGDGSTRQNTESHHDLEAPDTIDLIADSMDRHGLPGALTERLLRAAMPLAEKLLRAASALSVDPPIMTMAAALDNVFRFNPLSDKGTGRPLMLVGPPGSGKTITVAKLAAAAVLSNRKVNVITTDTMRAGGVGQLSAFTKILDIDLQTALDPESLMDALAAIEHDDADALTVIDTAGSNPFDAHEMDELGRLVGTAQCDTVLVLPAGFDIEEAAETARAFAGIGATRLLATRLDAAQRLGSILVAADVGQLEFCGLSVTPRVADGLTTVNPILLARLLIPEFIPATSVVALNQSLLGQGHSVS